MKDKQVKFKYLSDTERGEIEILKKKEYSIRKIAEVLGRSPNTISYELKRCTVYKASLGKQYARTKLKNRRFQWSKINENNELRNYIISKLKQYWNPDEIAGKMKREKLSFRVSKSTIYAWLETTRGSRYQKYLYKCRPGRRHTKTGAQGQLSNITSITERSKSINSRKTVGHWESDLVVSKRGTSGGISGSTERKSRLYIATKVADLTSQSKQKTLQLLTKEFLVSSITFDRGHENALHHELGIPTYFCDPYSSWQKGSVENGNKLLRRFFPKKTDFNQVTEERLQEVVSIINNKPRKILGYRSSLEVARELGVINSGVLIQG
jgi:transposase, IS30 family